jgi:outer membrane receptor protein involved in Fe transport
LSAVGKLNRYWTLSHGLNIDREHYDAYDALNAGPQLPPSRRTTTTLAIRPEAALLDNDLRLLGSAAYAVVRSDMQRSMGFGGVVVEADPVTRQRFDYRLGAAYAAADWLELRSNFNDAHREPTLLEMFGDAAFILPSPTLRPEHGRTVDAGVLGANSSSMCTGLESPDSSANASTMAWSIVRTGE